MKPPADPPSPQRPATWALLLAFTAVYLSWGTTYLAIKAGVRHLPPALFGGGRLVLAGLVLLTFLALRGERLRLPRRELLWVALAGILLFVGGNGLVTWAEVTVDSGVASVLVATTPLWIGLLGTLWPGGERLSVRGWLGLLVGLAGVLLLLTPNLRDPGAFLKDAGLLLVLASAFCWSIGSLVLRHRRVSGSHLVSAAYQMTLGGGAQVLIGLALGEGGELSAEQFTPAAVYAFFHLLVVGSLIGFVAYNWLLGHVSAALAGTYAYVNPLVAVVIGAFMGGEELTGWVLGGMVIILAGVALVRTGGAAPRSGDEEVSWQPVIATEPRS